jgi:hypothetical protein
MVSLDDREVLAVSRAVNQNIAYSIRDDRADAASRACNFAGDIVRAGDQ